MSLHFKAEIRSHGEVVKDFTVSMSSWGNITDEDIVQGSFRSLEEYRRFLQEKNPTNFRFPEWDSITIYINGSIYDIDRSTKKLVPRKEDDNESI